MSTRMATPIKIMFIGFHTPYIDTLQEVLRDNGYSPDVRIAGARKDVVAMMLFGSWDCIVISGTQVYLPPAQVIDLTNTYHADTPILLTIETFEYQKVLDALRAGAHDVLVESEKASIIPAFERVKQIAGMIQKVDTLQKEVYTIDQILDHAHSALVAWNIDNRISHWNRTAERMYGWKKEEVVGKDLWSVLFASKNTWHSDVYATVLKAGSWQGELEQVSRDGKAWVAHTEWAVIRDVKGEISSVYMAALDITEARKLEERFLQSQRLNTMDSISGGMAHDLNNILSPILSAGEILKSLIEDAKILRIVDTIEQNTTRAARLIRHALQFSRGGDGQKSLVDPADIIRDLENFIRRTFPKSVHVEIKVEEALPRILCNAIQIEQVLLNLCINARDSMAEKGKLSVQVFQYRNNTPHIGITNVPAGSYVCFSVIDDGHGISAENLKKIFDPFFTTKPEGKGAGLGLYTAYNLVDKHNGIVRVQSKPNAGTAFHVLLPANVEDTRTVNEEPVHQPDAESSTTLLLVDDEEDLLLVMSKILQKHGYIVLTARNGEEALLLYSRHKSTIRAVIIDIFMPVMDGVATIQALRSINPHLNVIATSAAPDPLQGRSLKASDLDDLLQKPFSMEQLIQSVTAVLAGDND